jgi:hypothetical protein
MMNRAFFVLMIGLALSLFGCSRDSDVLAFSQKLDEVATQVEAKATAGKDPGAGIDEAQKYLESQAGDLKAKYAELAELRGFQVKEESIAKLTEGVTNSTMKVAGLKLKFIRESMEDKALDGKLEKLSKTYEGIFE